MVSLEKRLEFWDSKLRNKREYTRAELENAFEKEFEELPSVRTFRSDMKELRKRKAPLSIKRFDTKNSSLESNTKNRYFYTDDFILTVKQPFTIEDAERINQAVSILKQFKHLPQIDDLNVILLKLEHEAGIKLPEANKKEEANKKNKANKKEEANKKTEANEKEEANEKQEIIAFHQAPNLTGLNHLETLYIAIRDQKVLGFFYTEFGKTPIPVVFHPYFLKQYNNRWFVYGLDKNENKLRPYALDRINNISPKQYYYEPTDIKFNKYFDNRIGISFHGHELFETVVVRVQKPRAFYVDTKHWHISQKTLDDTPQYMDFQFEVLINKELEAQVLEFGKDIEVLQPASFREQIRQIHLQALAQYEK